MQAVARAPVDWAGLEAGDHFVQFYQDEAAFEGTLAAYCATGLRRGETVLVIAAAARLTTLRDALCAEGDVDGAERFGRYLPVESESLLARFMVGGMPSAERFARVLGEILEPRGQEVRKVRVFGEMVAILWEQGECEAALRLEELWNDLIQARRLMLFCAYPQRLFGSGRLKDGGGMERICRCHSHVLPMGTAAA